MILHKIPLFIIEKSGCPPLLARRLLCVGRQVVRSSHEPCGAVGGWHSAQWSRCSCLYSLGESVELFEV